MTGKLFQNKYCVYHVYNANSFCIARLKKRAIPLIVILYNTAIKNVCM